MGQYLPVLLLLILASLFAGVSLVMSRLVAPRRETVTKAGPYECGIVPSRQNPERFPVRFYLVAMIFIVFDIEIIFLYPYAVIQGQLGAFGLIEIVVFAVAVFASFVYLLANGALDWGPASRLRRAGGAVDPNRTVSSTVRKVGLEGRRGEDHQHDGGPGPSHEVAA